MKRILVAEDEDVTGQLVRDATIFANKEVVIMLLQSIAAFLRIPAGSDANTVRIALNDEENVASLHLHYGCGFAVLTSAVNSLANTIAHGHNAVVVNFGVSVEIVCHSNSQLGKFGRINSTFASTFECMAGKQHVVHVFEALMFYFAAIFKSGTFDVFSTSFVGKMGRSLLGFYINCKTSHRRHRRLKIEKPLPRKKLDSGWPIFLTTTKSLSWLWGGTDRAF